MTFVIQMNLGYDTRSFSGGKRFCGEQAGPLLGLRWY